MKYLLAPILRYFYNYIKILNITAFLLLSLCLLINYVVAEESTKKNTNTFDISLLRSLQSSYYQLINFPKQKKQNLETGKAIVMQFVDNSVNLSQLIQVLHPKKEKHFINSLIVRIENNVATTPGKDIVDAITAMLNKDNTLIKLQDEINQFHLDMQSRGFDKVINYAVSQSAIDSESKKITKLAIKPRLQIMDNLQQEYKDLFSNIEFEKNLTRKLLEIIPNTSFIKLPLIEDIHKINPIISPYAVVNKPYLEHYFEDDFGNIMLSKKQINSAAEQLLPKTDISSIFNIDAACVLIDSIVSETIFNKHHSDKKNINGDYLLKRWVHASIDDFSIKNGYLKYGIPQKENGKLQYKLRLNAQINAVTANKLLGNFILSFYYAYVDSNVAEHSESKTKMHSICRLFCLKGAYKINNFIVSANSYYGTTINKGKRTDRKYFIHKHSNNSKIYTASINLDYNTILDSYWRFIPNLFSKYSYYTHNKYTEESEYIASNILNCIVNPSNNKYLSFGIGGVLRGEFVTPELYIKPNLSFAIIHQSNRQKNYLDATLCGVDIRRELHNTGSTKANFGIATSILGRNISCNIKYLLEIHREYNSNVFFFEFSYIF
jgi:hypothetical protein